MKIKVILLMLLISMQVYAMQYDNNDFKEASENTKKLVRQALIDYKLNPDKYTIKSFRYPSPTKVNYTDDRRNLIVINTDDNNPDLFKIYHAAAHIKNKSCWREFLTGLGVLLTPTPLAASMVYFLNEYYESIFFTSFGTRYVLPLCALGLHITTYMSIKLADYTRRKSKEHSEVIAVHLACQKLLEKQDFDSICLRLAMLKRAIIDKTSGTSYHSIPEAEYKDLEVELNKNAILIKDFSNNKDLVSIELIKNEQLLSKKIFNKNN